MEFAEPRARSPVSPASMTDRERNDPGIALMLAFQAGDESAFDRIVEQFGCERLKTIGDAYMAVCGLPEPNPDHAHNLAAVALRFVRFLQKRNQASEFEWRCRIGLNTGPVIGSVVGVQKYVYDIFGPGVNLAARLEPMCGPMQILVSDETAKRIKDRFRMTDHGIHDIRGFGNTRVHCLDGECRDG